MANPSMKTFFTYNPTTGERLKKHRLQGSAETKKALLKARNAQHAWKNLPAEDRTSYITRVARLLEKRKHGLARTASLEMGKPVTEAQAEIEKCALACTYFAQHAATFLQPETIKTDYKKSFVRFDPLGIILAIMPWNFPFWQAFRCAVPAICAGNVVLLKHSNQVPQCSLEIHRLFAEAGCPPGVFTSLLIDAAHAKVEKMLQNKFGAEVRK